MERDIYAYLKEQKTDMIENNRLSNVGGGKRRTDDSMVGDYDTPEQKVGKLDMNVPWESCFTLSSQWAWKPNDNIKSLDQCLDILSRSEEHTSELQSLMRISYAVFCLKKNTTTNKRHNTTT